MSQVQRRKSAQLIVKNISAEKLSDRARQKVAEHEAGPPSADVGQQ